MNYPATIIKLRTNRSARNEFIKTMQWDYSHIAVVPTKHVHLHQIMDIEFHVGKRINYDTHKVTHLNWNLENAQENFDICTW